jgi:thaumarchaeosortase
MQKIRQVWVRNNLTSFFIRILPIIAIAVPLGILYFLYPASFEATWKGRTYYIFFIWILCLETVLNWEILRPRSHRLRSLGTVIVITTLIFPTVYVLVANYTQLNTMIVDASPKYYLESPSDPSYWARLMPLTVEYFALAAGLAMILLGMCGLKGLKDFSLSLCLVGIIGSVYLIDNLYPNGNFTPFQILVPATTSLAANILNAMGYRTQIIGAMPVLKATSPSGSTFAAVVGWPCSGVESLIIYTVIVLLVLGRTQISLIQKATYFFIGAVITYIINALRIATIFIIATNGGDWATFHNYYGQLYSISWIVSYLLIILASQALWLRIKSRRTNSKIDSGLAKPSSMPTATSTADEEKSPKPEV